MSVHLQDSRKGLVAPGLLVLGSCLFAGFPSTARADMDLKISSGSGNYDSGVVNANSVGYSSFVSGNVGAFNIVLTYGTSNSPGGESAITTLSNVVITNTDQLHAQTITIQVSATGFTSPNSPPPLVVTDTVSGTVTSGSLNNITAQGFADKTNALFGTGFQSTLLTTNNVPIVGSTSFSLDGSNPGFSPNGATYSLTFTETLTVSAGGSITGTNGNVEAVPEPATVVCVLAGLPVLGLAGWVRRRRQAKAALAA